MLISIIVPVYNIENWIEKCIKSVLDQSNKDFELILVDDGSKDESGAICDQYEKTYPDTIRVIHKINGGLSDARNAGVAEAKGEYLLFVDGDDYISTATVEHIKESINLYHADVVLSAGLIRVNENGDQSINQKFKLEQFQNISGETAIIRTVPYGPNWSACGKAFRRSFWLEHGYEFKKNRTWEDFQIIDKIILSAEKVSMIPAFYYYQYRAGSIVHSVKAKDIAGLLQSFAEWRSYLEEQKFEKTTYEAIMALHAVIYVQTILGYAGLVEVERRSDIIQDASQYQYLLNYGTSKQVKLVKILDKVFGFENTCRILATIKRIRYQKNAI